MNFEFISQFKEFNNLYNNCVTAEQLCLTNYNVCVSTVRSCNEYIIKFIYKAKVGDPGTLTTFDLLDDTRFIIAVNDDTLIGNMHFLRMLGNNAVHGINMKKNDALDALENLHFIVGEFFISIGKIADYPVYISPEDFKQLSVDNKKIETKSTNVDTVRQIEIDENIVSKYAQRMRFLHFAKKYEEGFKNNTKKYVMACLAEAGWKITEQDNIVLPATATMNFLFEGTQHFDVAQFGFDSKPLAIIDYTECKENLIIGKKKLMDYGKLLAQKYGFMPIMYYCIGYAIFCIDGLWEKPRRVFGIHTIRELELIILRRKTRTSILTPSIDQKIVNRKYQNEAITKICQTFESGRRKSLIVLATGTGKTRVSIALVDVLLKNNWVKNILFLADRTSLVNQAKRSFEKLLPNTTTSVFTADSLGKDPNARLIFSTYQSMITMIDGENKVFTPGHFDLVIIDEAHRSIFSKFGFIFKYYDSMLLGLTATPRGDQTKSTYKVFDIDSCEPDYDYELKEAVNEGYLVGFSVLDRTTNLLKREIAYSSLSEEEKEKNEQMVEIWESQMAQNPDDDYFTHKKLDGKTVNIPTIDIMLDDLMKNGLKVDNGDKIGKTIIFAKTHFEADIMKERFDHLYGHLGEGFCEVIDSYSEDSQYQIDHFTDRNSLPQVAITVSLLDTGIDVPDILNLVFFKPICSKIKFLQMIGRGTRLSPNIFGPGQDKKGFFVFDYYDNFEFFATKENWKNKKDNDKRKYLTQNINEYLLNIAHYMINSSVDEDRQKAKEYIDELYNATVNLVNDSIDVQANFAYVEKYRDKHNWNVEDKESIKEIVTKIIPLLPSRSETFKRKMFNLTFYSLEWRSFEIIYSESVKHVFTKNTLRAVRAYCNALLKLENIEAVNTKKVIIEELLDNLKSDDFLDKVSYREIEGYRSELISLADYINLDQYTIVMELDDELRASVKDEVTNEDKFNKFIITNKLDIINKIRNLEELTEDEYEGLLNEMLFEGIDIDALRGTKEKLAYIRTHVGFTSEAVEFQFGTFLNLSVLTGMQMEFCNKVIEFARQNGDFIPKYLQTVSPFCDVDVIALFGSNITYLKQLINGIHKPISEDKWKF